MIYVFKATTFDSGWSNPTSPATSIPTNPEQFARPGDLDDAAMRRLPLRIYIPLPELETRKELVRSEAFACGRDGTRRRGCWAWGLAADGGAFGASCRVSVAPLVVQISDLTC